MKNKINVLLILLVFGELFASIIKLRFNVNSGFEYKGMGISNPLDFINVGGNSNVTFLDTTILGYLFYLIFGWYSMNLKITNRTFIYNLTLLFGLVAIGIGVELYNIIMDVTNSYYGFRFTFTAIIFLVALSVYMFARKHISQESAIA